MKYRIEESIVMYRKFFYITLVVIFATPLNVQAAATITHDKALEQELRDAAEEGDVSKVKKLIESGVNANAIDDFGNTALIGADNEDIVKLLIKAKANVNASNNAGYTSLMVAARDGQENVVQLLLNEGADINNTNIYGETALMLSASTIHGDLKNKDIIELLLLAGADLEIKNKKNKQAIDYAKEKTFFMGGSTQQKKEKAEIIKLLENEPKRREEAIKTRRESIKKIIAGHLPTVLSNVISEYLPTTYEYLPEDETKNVL